MYENLEGTDYNRPTIESMSDFITPAASGYINECVEEYNSSALINRIDELCPYQPPKGIDFNADIAELIEPVKADIESKYLEAPADIEQISQIGDYLSTSENIRYENWKTLSLEERCELLQTAENGIAQIEHRTPCTIRLENLEEGCFGYYSDQTITLNARYIDADDFDSYRETLDTLIHEGRHAYQEYNMTEREVHPRSGEVNMWKWNINEIGYQSAELFGFEIYSMQPLESDARAFAEDVLNDFFTKCA